MNNKTTIYIITILFILLTLTVFWSTTRAVTKENAPYLSAKEVPKQRSLTHLNLKKEAQLGTLTNWLLINYGNVESEPFDVIVIGSDPEGIMAAIAAAREGQKTLLIDKKKIVGGLYTLGKLNMLDINWSPSNESLNKGLFLEFYKKINNRTSFDVTQVQQVFEEMLYNEKNISIELGSQSIIPLMNDNHVEALFYKDQNGEVKKATGKQYIDSTPDADFAQLAGATFTIGQEDYRNEPKMMAVTLVFELSGINWESIQNYLNKDDEVYTGADEYSAWGYGKEMARYKPSQDHVRIRALNIGKQNSGTVLINAFQILGVNGLSETDLREARHKASIELPKITEFIRQNLIGFENAKLIGTAKDFYVRETRHLNAEYKLTVNDVLENHDFKDRIAFGSYPIDVQATVLTEGDIIVGNPTQYAIPFRSIVPKGFDNLLVASRSAGYDSLAHGSARTVPIGMVVGQAAGVAAAYANNKHINFQEIINDKSLKHISQIQLTLNRNGADLYPIPPYDNPIVNHWAYEGVKFLRSYALIAAGYDNKYDMEQPLSKETFTEYIRLISQYADLVLPIQLPFSGDKDNITQDEIIKFLEANNLSRDALSSLTKEKLNQQSTIITRAVAYMVIKEFFEIKNNGNPLETYISSGLKYSFHYPKPQTS